MTRPAPVLAQVAPEDIPDLDHALRQLAATLGDPYAASPETLRHALFGPDPSARALLARADGTLAGAALYSPVVSTMLGGAGAFVSDLWVAPGHRGTGLGARLLAHAARDAADRWRAVFLKLAVHDGNTGARLVYERLGFAPRAGETGMLLTGAAFDRIRTDR